MRPFSRSGSGFKLLQLAFCGTLFLSSVTQTWSQDCSTDAMLVFDGSGSMAEMGFNGLDRPRIVEARAAMHASIPEIATYRKLGLVTYGEGGEEACNNVNLKFKPITDAASRILGEIDSLTPAGNTPLTSAVEIAADTLDYETRPGVIVLVTDGRETCGGATCRLAATLASKGQNLTIHVVGFQVRGDFFAWKSQDVEVEEYENGVSVARCLADRNNGSYYSTETTDELVEAMQEALGCAIIGMARNETVEG